MVLGYIVLAPGWKNKFWFGAQAGRVALLACMHAEGHMTQVLHEVVYTFKSLKVEYFLLFADKTSSTA